MMVVGDESAMSWGFGQLSSAQGGPPMESLDEILRLPGRTPRARQRKHCSVIASKEFRQLDWITKEFLRFSVTVRPRYFSGSSQVFAFLLVHPAGHIIIKVPSPSSSTAASIGSHSTPRWKLKLSDAKLCSIIRASQADSSSSRSTMRSLDCWSQT